jgi:hypothetical protein
MEESFVSVATIRLDRGGFSPLNGSFNWLKFVEEGIGRLIINYYRKYCSVIQFFIFPRISKEPVSNEVRYCKQVFGAEKCSLQCQGVNDMRYIVDNARGKDGSIKDSLIQIFIL